MYPSGAAVPARQTGVQPLSGAPGGLVLPGGTPDNPLAMGLPGPAVVTLPLTPLRVGSCISLDQMRQTTAPVTVVAEVDATNLKRWHDWNKPGFEAATGMPLTYLAFFARATVKGLMAHPILNAMLTGSGYTIPRQVDLGVAMQGPECVLIPVIRHAESKPVPQLAQELHQQAQRARSGQIRMEEMTGQTFVMTNPGRWGQTLFGTPTIKAPNVGILSFEAIKKRPVALENDLMAVRPMMYLALTADHRAVDGADMFGFLAAVRYYLENPVY